MPARATGAGALLRAAGRGVMPKASPSEKAPAKTPAKANEPRVKLGYVDPTGIAPSLYALVERGAGRRPKVVAGMRGVVELRFKEKFAPVRIEFAEVDILVEDAAQDDDRGKPDLLIQGSLPDVVQLAAAPLMGGVPKVTDRRGRAALARVAGRRVKIEGSPLLAQRLLKLLEL
jgi:hypothetical protein